MRIKKLKCLVTILLATTICISFIGCNEDVSGNDINKEDIRKSTEDEGNNLISTKPFGKITDINDNEVTIALVEEDDTGNSVSYTLTGEEKTFDIEDENVIAVEKGEVSMAGTMDDIIISEIVSVEFGSDGKVTLLDVQCNNSSYTGGAQSGSITLTGTYSVDNESKESKDEVITSYNSDETAILVSNKGILSISNAEINKSGDTSSEEESNFYAVNSGIVSAGEGVISISDSSITTDSEGSNAVFATGDGSVINIADSTIQTSQNSSRGLDATYNGTVIADNVDITTSGAHCASVATDRGEGTCYFNMTNGSIEALEGPMFYITNTEAVINLRNAALKADSGILLNAAEGRWGNEGANGGNVTLNAKNQSLRGDVTCDSISSISINLSGDSIFEGTVNGENSGGVLKISLDKTSRWNVTGDSYLTVFKDNDEQFSNINDNGNIIYYDSSNEGNSWLNGKIITLSDGGKLTPLQ